MALTPDARRGQSFRRRLRALPTPTRRLVLAGVVLGWLALWYGALLALNTWLLDEPGWTEPLPSMAGAVVGGGFVLWLQRRRMGSLRRAWDVDRATRRGRLPEDADLAEWGPLLERAVGFQRGARSLALGFTALSVVGVVLGFAWVGFGWMAVLVTALVGAALLAFLEVASRRQSRRIERLQDQVRDLPDRGQLTTGG